MGMPASAVKAQAGPSPLTLGPALPPPCARPVQVALGGTQPLKAIVVAILIQDGRRRIHEGIPLSARNSSNWASSRMPALITRRSAVEDNGTPTGVMPIAQLSC